MNLRKTLTEAYTKLRGLRAQQVRVVARIDSNNQRHSDLLLKVTRLAKEVTEKRGQAMRGVISEASVASFVDQETAARREFAEVQENCNLAKATQHTLLGELVAAQSEAIQALDAYADEIYRGFVKSLQSDRTLQGKLKEIYAAAACSRDTGLDQVSKVNWLFILEEIFPEPKPEEMNEYLDQFKEKFGFPTLGSPQVLEVQGA